MFCKINIIVCLIVAICGLSAHGDKIVVEAEENSSDGSLKTVGVLQNEPELTLNEDGAKTVHLTENNDDSNDDYIDGSEDNEFPPASSEVLEEEVKHLQDRIRFLEDIVEDELNTDDDNSEKVDMLAVKQIAATLTSQVSEQNNQLRDLRMENERLWGRLLNISKTLENQQTENLDRSVLTEQIFHLLIGKVTEKNVIEQGDEEGSCFLPLGMESGRIPNDAITASEVFSWKFPAWGARLRHRTGWYSRRVQDPETEYWVQVKLAKAYKITRIALQSAPYKRIWLRKFRLASSVDGVHWTAFKENGRVTVLDGTKLWKTFKMIDLHQPIYGRYFRIISLAAHGRWVGFRFELYGCEL